MGKKKKKKILPLLIGLFGEEGGGRVGGVKEKREKVVVVEL